MASRVRWLVACSIWLLFAAAGCLVTIEGWQPVSSFNSAGTASGASAGDSLVIHRWSYGPEKPPPRASAVSARLVELASESGYITRQSAIRHRFTLSERLPALEVWIDYDVWIVHDPETREFTVYCIARRVRNAGSSGPPPSLPLEELERSERRLEAVVRGVTDD